MSLQMLVVLGTVYKTQEFNLIIFDTVYLWYS